MRKPTKNELWHLRETLKGLQSDIEALELTEDELRATGVCLSDVLGTFGVNIGALSRIHQRLQSGDPPPRG